MRGIVARIAGFAIQDLLHQRRRFGAATATVAAAIAPLLMLLGLKAGVVDSLRADLESDPANLELVYEGHDTFDPAWIEELRARPETGFAIPRNARYLSAAVELVNDDDRSRAPVEVMLEPTGPGDPVIGPAAALASGTTVLLSAGALERLALPVGGTTVAYVTRTREDGRNAVHRFDLMIGGVVAEEREKGFVAFVDPALTGAVERYRVTGNFDLAAVSTASFPSFRLYARDIDAVIPLRDALIAGHHQVSANTASIIWVRRLSDGMDSLFAVLGLVLALGGTLAVSASLSANILAQERQIALLRVAGYGARSLAVFPLVQGIAVVLAGGLIALLSYVACAPLFDMLLRDRLSLSGGAMAFDLPRLLLLVGGLVMAGIVASLGAARYVTTMDATRRLRDA